MREDGDGEEDVECVEDEQNKSTQAGENVLIYANASKR